MNSLAPSNHTSNSPERTSPEPNEHGLDRTGSLIVGGSSLITMCLITVSIGIGCQCYRNKQTQNRQKNHLREHTDHHEAYSAIHSRSTSVYPAHNSRMNHRPLSANSSDLSTSNISLHFPASSCGWMKEDLLCRPTPYYFYAQNGVIPHLAGSTPSTVSSPPPPPPVIPRHWGDTACVRKQGDCFACKVNRERSCSVVSGCTNGHADIF